MFSTVLYYVISCSVILYYGVGINRLLTIKKDFKTYVKSFLKSLTITVTTTALSWLVIKFILSPLGITELFPLISAIFFMTIGFLVHTFIRTSPIDIAEDYAVPLIIVFISLMECSGLLSGVIISASCVSSFYLFGTVVFALRRRFRLYGKEEGFKPVSLILISMALICIALYCWNASWLSLGLNSSF